MIEKCEAHLLLEDKIKRHDNEIKDIKEDVSGIKEDINSLKISQTEVNTKFISFMESMKDLPKILDGFKEAMLGMQYEIKDIKQDIKDIKETQDDNDDKVKEVKSEINEIDNKSKIDILLIIKNNWWKILIGATTLLVSYNEIINIIK